MIKRVHEYFTFPSFSMIIKLNTYVPPRHNRGIPAARRGRNDRLDSLESNNTCNSFVQ